MTMRLRHPTMFGSNDRMFSPARDITLISYPVIRGALTAAQQARPELEGEMLICSQALAGYFSKVVTDKRKLPELLAELRQSLAVQGISRECRQLVLEEISYGFLLNFGEGAREASDSKNLLDDQIANLTEQGVLLSTLSPALRGQVEKELKAAYVYEGELDRKPLKGEILEEMPDGAETGKDTPAAKPE